MEAYENGETKGQKPPSKYWSIIIHAVHCYTLCLYFTFIGSIRQLEKVVEFKQHYFEPLQNLQKQLQIEILHDVLSGQSTIAEMQERAREQRSLKFVKEMYIRCDHTATHYTYVCTKRDTIILINQQTGPQL